MINAEAVLGLPGYQITGIEERAGKITIQACYEGVVQCPECSGERLRLRDGGLRRLRHESWGVRHVFVGTGDWFHDFLKLRGSERQLLCCPAVLGIDEHFFSRKQGYATTLCDLKNHSFYDVIPGRSEASLEAYCLSLEGKRLVRVVCMDLASVYRAIVRKHFPHARIVADRFHVIRLINHHFLSCWRDLDAVGSQNPGLLSLMRRHRHHLQPAQAEKLAAYLAERPALELIYRFKQKLCYLLLKKHRTRKQCETLVPRLLRAIYQLRQAGFAPLVALGQTLASWSNEIAAMWRFTRNNGITEGFHTKMELLQRQAYGFRNFQNYRLGVRVLCS